MFLLEGLGSMENTKKETKHVTLSEMLPVKQNGTDQSRPWQSAFGLEGEKLAQMLHGKL
jgi:hypothetical protein